jgi:hypothetical protein
MSDDEQGRLFDPERYSPVRIDAILRLPSGTTQAFWIASTLGSFLRLDGSSDRLKGGRDASGTLVRPRRRAVILKVLGISDRHWRRLVEDWERRNIAHACGRGTVFLFAHALLDTCPACHAYVEVAEMPPPPKRRRGAGFGQELSGQADESCPESGTNMSGRPVQTRPVSGTNLPHQEDRVQQEVEVGMGGSSRGRGVRRVPNVASASQLSDQQVQNESARSHAFDGEEEPA